MNQSENSLRLCCLFSLTAVNDLKVFFSQFKKVSKGRTVFLQINAQNLTLMSDDQIRTDYILGVRLLYVDANGVIDKISIFNPMSKWHDNIILEVIEADSMFQGFTQIIANPKDLRCYFDSTQNQLYFTLAIVRLDDTQIVRQIEVELKEDLQPLNACQIQPIMSIPTFIINSLAAIALHYDTFINLDFHKIGQLYALVGKVYTENEQFYQSFIPSQIEKIPLGDSESFFQIHKSICQCMQDLTSIDGAMAIQIQETGANNMILHQYSVNHLGNIGFLKQYIIPRMYF